VRCMKWSVRADCHENSILVMSLALAAALQAQKPSTSASKAT
jgi:hypothetical protein